MWVLSAKRYLDMQDLLAVLVHIPENRTISPDSRADFVDNLGQLIAEMDHPDLMMCKKAAERLQSHMTEGATRDQTVHSAQDLRLRLLDQFESIYLLALSVQEKALYAPSEPLFGPEVRSQFPSVTYDIDEAAKCLALSRSTASVFHLMRVVEAGLKAAHRCLGLPEPKNPNWGSYLTALSQEIGNRGSQWREKAWFKDLYQRADAIKDAQRNPTLHTETVHTEEDAHTVFRGTEQFMKTISSRMDEKGEPKA